MDEFKQTTLNEYRWQKALSKEYGKNKVRHCTKKQLRKLSRTRLNRKNQLVKLI